jgi:vacuolar-type H+-ATPase subunit E/Vma4
MPLEEPLREELRREIEDEVEAIRGRAEKQGEALVTKAERWSEQRTEEASRRLEEDCRLRLRRSLARAELEQRNEILRLKRQEVDQVFQMARERLTEMQKEHADAYEKLMSEVWENCRQLLPGKGLVVRLGPGLEKLGERLSAEDGVTVETDERTFGLLVEAEKGRLHCDGTIPRLLERLRREREAELEAVLFGGEK